MTDYDLYVFLLCLIVFILLAALSAVCLTYIVKLSVRLIRCGGMDAQINKEYERITGKTTIGERLLYLLSVLICVVFIAMAAFSIYLNFTEVSTSDTIPTIRVVQSTSMAEKYSGNTYLTENDLNDQFDMFDLVLTYKMPDEYDLQLYDIVVYRYEDDGELIIHRIIAIEEPNDSHPDCRYFTIRGDAVSYSDTNVTYDQMVGIYRGEHVRYIGSFVMFLQSPAGWLCVALLAAVVFLSPVLENYIGGEKLKRLQFLQEKRAKALKQEIHENQAQTGEYNKDGFYDIVEGNAKNDNKNTGGNKK